MKALFSSLIFFSLLVVGCQADDTTTSIPAEKEKETPPNATLEDLHLNAFAPYSEGPNGPIRLGVLFELDAQKESELAIAEEYQKITTALEQLFTGDFGLFSVPPFSEHREKFSISYASILASEDKNYYPITEAQLAAVVAHLQKNKLLLQNAPNAAVVEKLREESFQEAGITPEYLESMFLYLDPLGLSVSYHDVDKIPATTITTNAPKDYTQAEKDWIIKRNLARVETLFETSPITVRVLISDNISGGYAYVPKEELGTPMVFMSYSIPYIEPVFPHTLARTFVHEMGHITGHFKDEYYPFETDTNLEKSISCNCVSAGATLFDGSAFNDPSDSSKNPWLQQSLPYENNRHEVAYDLISGPVPNYNGQLYEGCAGGRYKSYRTHNLSIMSYHYLFMDPTTFAQGFGPVHRHYMKELFFKKF